MYKEPRTPQPNRIYSRHVKAGSTFENQFIIIHHIKRLKKKNEEEKSHYHIKKYTFDKIQYPFTIETQKTRNKGELPPLYLKSVQKNPTANITLNDEKLDAFPLISETKQCPLLTTPIQHYIEVLANAIRQETKG